MKKFLALVCTLCLLLTALPLTALAADDDWVTLNVEMYDRSIAGFNVEDCWQLHYIQENFGNPNHIKVNWIPVSRWEEGTILSTRLAGGTAPDICMTYGTDLVQQYIDMGGIMPLDDLLAEYGQELTAFVGDEVLQYGQYDVGDGKEQYYLPARRIIVATQSMFIRKDWLEKLGMEVPTNVEQLYAYLKAAKEQKLGGEKPCRIPPTCMRLTPSTAGFTRWMPSLITARLPRKTGWRTTSSTTCCLARRKRCAG